MPVIRANVRDNRTDLSPFMFHLTRDDRGQPDGATARENFENILASGEIAALRPHCMHADDLPEYARKRFNVSCYSETPLSQIKMLVRKIIGRRIKLASYGLAFKREFLIAQGAKPVHNVISYGGDMAMREAYDEILERAIRTKQWNKALGVLPFLSAMHERYDFSWEREWRVRGPVKFTMDDVEFVILPEGIAIDLHLKLKKQGVMVICPTWGYEKTIERIADQHRRLRRRLEAMAEK